MTEETGADYASEKPGLMHACGHDGHTSVLLGAAAILQQHRDRFPGAVKLLFQPAEEGGAAPRKWWRRASSKIRKSKRSLAFTAGRA